MRVWIQSHKRERPANKNFFEAMCGFEELGAEIRFFHNPLEMRQAEPADILVGYVESGNLPFLIGELLQNLSDLPGELFSPTADIL